MTLVHIQDCTCRVQIEAERFCRRTILLEFEPGKFSPIYSLLYLFNVLGFRPASAVLYIVYYTFIKYMILFEFEPNEYSPMYSIFSAPFKNRGDMQWDQPIGYTTWCVPNLIYNILKNFRMHSGNIDYIQGWTFRVQTQAERFCRRTVLPQNASA